MTEDVQAQIDDELRRLRSGPPPNPGMILHELEREVGYRRRVYPNLVTKGLVGARKVAKQIWIVEHLLEKAKQQREEQTT